MIERITRMKLGERKTIEIQGRAVDFRIIQSKKAQSLRVRVGPNGVEVVEPTARSADDAVEFLRANGRWVCKQLDRIQRLHPIRRPAREEAHEILFRGNPTLIRISKVTGRSLSKIVFENGQLVIQLADRASTSIA